MTALSALAGLLVASVSAVVLAWAGWWTLLCALALPRPHPRAEPAPRGLRLAVVVPAHDEEARIGRCVETLLASGLALSPPPEVLVVADNCADATAARARAAGAAVLERCDPARRGKGYALAAGLEAIARRPGPPPHAVVFVDADCEVSGSFLPCLAARLAGGAAAVQAYYAGDRGAAPLQRLRRLAFALVHWSRPLGASRVGLGGGIKGTGFALSWEAAALVAPSGSITEDAELTLTLARRGIAVAFEPHAVVWGRMAGEYDDARVQDERWERGRLQLVPAAATTALDCLRRGRPAAAGAALEVAAPPLSALLLAQAAALGVAALLARSRLAPALAGTGALALYVVTGLLAARPPAEDLLALRTAPGFMRHKIAVYARVLRRPGDTTWQRTGRR